MPDIIYQAESYQVIGICMEVHNVLGPGFLEIVYKDALEYEFKNAGIPCEREKLYKVHYKHIVLTHQFVADFVVFDKIILEIKGGSKLTDDFTARCINYLKVSENRLALLVNFGEIKLNHKRIVF